MLGIAPLILLGISILVSALSTGASIYFADRQADKAKAANDKQMDRQTRTAKAQHLRQYNQAVRALGTGYAMAKKDILESKRETAAAERYDYGTPEARR